MGEIKEGETGERRRGGVKDGDRREGRGERTCDESFK